MDRNQHVLGIATCVVIFMAQECIKYMIFLGDEADSEIDGLSLKTGGNSYFIDVSII